MGDVKDSIKILLDQITKERGYINNTSKEKNGYNIFHVLGIEYNEVLICRFIGDLLNPNGKHGLGCEPLRQFILHVLKDDKISENELEKIDSAKIVLEQRIDNDRRVDIVIYLENKIYPIEVKVWAYDQKSQLNDYYHYFFKNDTNQRIYYITPYGWKPSSESKCILEDKQIKCISFSKDIHCWLDCIEKSSNNYIQTIIRNFMEVIEKMCMQNDELNVISEVLGLNDNSSNNPEQLKSAITLLKYSDKIWGKIREKYLREKLILGNTNYYLERCDEEDEKIKYTLLYVKDADGTTVAWICVETNLYIVVNKDGADDACDWTPYNEEYKWKYIVPKGFNKTALPLNKPIDLSPYGDIELGTILKQIT